MNPESTADIRAVITATDAGASATLAGFGKSVSSLGAAAGSVGSDMTKYLTLPIVAVGAASAKMAINFQQQMELVRTQAGASQQEVDSMSKAVLDLAQASEFGPQKLAEALFHVESTGLRGAAAMDVLKAASEGASVGQADLTDTTNTLLGVMNSHITGVKNATDAMGVLNAIVGAGNLKMQDLNEAMGTGVAATAATFGVTLQSVGAALAEMTAQGVPATKAATQLNMAMVLMAAPTQNAAKILTGIGISANDVQAATSTMTDALAKAHITTNSLADDLKQPNGLSVAIQDLKTHLQSAGVSADAADAIIARAFGGGRSGKAVLELGADIGGVNDKYAQIIKSSGDFQNQVDAQAQTMNAKLHVAWANLQVDMIKLGSQLLPVLAKALSSVSNEIQKLSNWYNQLSPAQKTIINNTLLLVATIGPALLIFSKLVKVVTDIKVAFMALGGVMKIFSFASMASEAAGAASAVEGVGGAAAGLGAAGGLAGLASILGPVALGVGAVAVTAGLAYLAYKKWHDAGIAPTTQALSQFNQTAKDVGYTVTQTGPKVDLLTLAQVHAKDATNILNSALTQNANANVANEVSQKASTDATNAYKDAQDKAQKALAQFGQNSPQYQAAANTVTGAYDALAQTLNDGANKALSLQIAGGVLSNAESGWRDATYNLGLTQIALNNYLQGGVGVIAQFGPTALNQVTAIDTLQVHIGAVAKSWSNLTIDIQSQNPILNNSLQGLGSTIDRIQGQSSTLNASLQASVASVNSLQNASANLQGTPTHHAAGGPIAAGELSWVGEKGPELFRPTKSGSIIPNNKLSSGGASQVNITVQAGAFMGSAQDARKYAQVILQAMQDLATSNGMSFDQLWRHHGVRAI